MFLLYQLHNQLHNRYYQPLPCSRHAAHVYRGRTTPLPYRGGRSLPLLLPIF